MLFWAASATHSCRRLWLAFLGLLHPQILSLEAVPFKGGRSMFQRLCLSMTPEVARAFGHEHSATAVLEQRLREAIGSRNWPLVVRSPRNLPGRIARRAELRQAFALESSPHFLGIECEPTRPHAGTDLRIFEDSRLSDETHPSPQMRKALVSQCFSSTPGEARTPNPRFRRPMLYPIELRARGGEYSRTRGFQARRQGAGRPSESPPLPG